MRRNYKAWAASVIPLMVLCFGCMLFALGQGGTGRLPSSANSRKNSSAPKPKPSSRKPRTPRPSTAPANNTGKQTVDEPKADDSAAIERTYWETIRLSTKAEDFKSYLEKYPNGLFAGLARYNLRRLETAAKTQLKTDSAGRIILGLISGSSDEEAKPAPKPGSIVGNQLGMELVYVPAGSFMMGSNNGEADEKPVHKVTIKEGFYMGRYEVTQAEWQQVMGVNLSYFRGARLPVDQVSWDEAQSFISKLNARGDGFKYRLPTEAEWEYACRAGTTGNYAGDLDKMAWYPANSGKQTHPVGSKQPNAFGLYDMHGNVWEWCLDAYLRSYNGAPVDGSVQLTVGEPDSRVVRGGSWYDAATQMRSANRGGHNPLYQIPIVGFRVVAIARTQ